MYFCKSWKRSHWYYIFKRIQVFLKYLHVCFTYVYFTLNFRSWQIILEKTKNTCQCPTQKFTGPETGSPPHRIRQSVDLTAPNAHQKVGIKMRVFFLMWRRQNFNAVLNSLFIHFLIWTFYILEPFPEYGIVIIVLGSLLVIVVIAAFFIYR